MNVGVTGASGHLGGVLVRQLLARGDRVRAFYHTDRRALAGLDCDCVATDICEPQGLRGAFDGIEVLYHLAARISITGPERGAVRRTNVDGVRHVLQEARAAGVRRVVHCSSIHAFALEARGRPIDESAVRVRTSRSPAYDRSKAAGEEAVRAAVATGLDGVIVNPTGVIGPFDFKPGRMGRVFLALQRGGLPALVSGGFDFVDVRDVAAGAIAAAERGRRGESYILSGHWKSMREVARVAAAVTGVRAPRRTVPMRLARLAAPWVATWARLTGAPPLFTPESLAALRANPEVSCAKAAAELAYAPRPFATTIADLYRWFEEAGMLARARARA